MHILRFCGLDMFFKLILAQKWLHNDDENIVVEREHVLVKCGILGPFLGTHRHFWGLMGHLGAHRM